MVNAAMKMIQASARIVDLHILTLMPPADDVAVLLKEKYAVKIHSVKKPEGKNPLLWMSFYKKISATLQSVSPHIVHVHGAWDFKAALVEQSARSNNSVTIVSPHRGISSEIIDIDFWSDRVWKLLSYQIRMLRKCLCVIAINESEKEYLRSSNFKRRVEVVTLGQQNDEDAQDTMNLLRDQLYSIYRKALDSSYEKFITPEEDNFLFATVQKALVDDEEITVPPTDGLSFRRIYFRAFDENAISLMQRGMAKTDFTLPTSIDVASIPRYPNKRAKKKQSLAESSSMAGKITIPAEQHEERNAVLILLNANEKKIDRLTYSDWAELYILFRQTDFNEDVVGDELKRLGLKKFTLKIQKKLRDMFYLKDGFCIY